MQSLEQQIFRRGSMTFYAGAKLFPKEIRQDVERLYSFLRVADDYVDSLPAQPKKFLALRRAWNTAQSDPHFDAIPTPTDSVDERVIKNIVQLTRTYGFDPAWIESFWDSMQADLDGKTYQTLDDTLAYMYGSAEIVGLMMSRIMHVPPQADEYARLQGRAFQWINFIRDIAEDNALGRCYFPAQDLQKFGLKDLSEQTARANSRAFKDFMHYQIMHYREWQTAAHSGLRHMPSLFRPGLTTATRMSDWTATQIAVNPLVVFDRKVKPGKARILAAGLRQFIAS
jgi:phytoene synthase